MSTAGKPITCRAAVVWKVGEKYSIENVEVAAPKKGEVRVKMTSTGICHSDLHLQEGVDINLKFPAILGHEGAGVIESVGEGVNNFKPGDLVILMFESYCGECDFCKSPLTNMCMKQTRNHLLSDGTSRISCKGQSISQMMSVSTFSEYSVVSAQNVTKISSKADPRTICLAGCCIPTGYGAAVNVGKVTKGSTVAVWGLGGVGMCVLMGCRDSGAARIIGIDTNPRKFELAKQFGATEFLNPKEVDNVPETLKEMTNGGVDVCFVSVGIVPVMEEAFNSSHQFWGKTVIIGISNAGEAMKVGIWDMLFGRKVEGTYFGSYKGGRDIPQLVDKIVDGKIELTKLISHRLPLDKINEGFDLMKNGDAIRSVIDFSLKE